MRRAVPESNPGLVELLALSVTFPFNIILGIPLYWAVIRWWWARPNESLRNKEM